MEPGNVLLYVLGAVVVAGILYWQYKAKQKKVAEFGAFAAKQGWQYLEVGDSKLENRFLEEPFGQGHDRRARHVFRGDHRGRKMHPRMMEWMLGDQRPLRYGFRFERGDLMIWDQGQLQLDGVMARLDYLCDVLDQVPDYVWK